MEVSSSNNMVLMHSLETEHADFVHDVSYDFYGTRMATCSSDHKVRIWHRAERPDQKWVLSHEWKAHKGSVMRVSWAHPEFGQLLATCSFDHSAIVWEETVERGRKNMGHGTRVWKNRVLIVDSKDRMLDIKFAPKHQGLKLATCDAEGVVRIYEAIDVMNLASWPIQEEFQTNLRPCNAMDWNTSPFDRPMIVVGGKSCEQGVASVQIFELVEAAKKFQVTAELALPDGPVAEIHDVAWAPNLGRSYHLIAAACADGRVYVWRVRLPGTERGATSVELVASLSSHGAQVWRVRWNVTGTILASSGDDGTVRTWKASGNGQWEEHGVLTSIQEMVQ